MFVCLLETKSNARRSSLLASHVPDIWKWYEGFRLTPCTQMCRSTWLALRRFLASRTRSLDIRSLALEEMWAQSFSGNSYFPSWILSNKVFWKWTNNLHQLSSSEQRKKCHFRLVSCPGLPGRCGRVLPIPIHSHRHSGLQTAGSHSAWCRGWRQGSTGHSACHRL